MKNIIEYKIPFSSKNIEIQIREFLNYYGKDKTVFHSYEVANKAKELAEKFNVPKDKAYLAGLLHDISVVIPDDERIELQKSLGEEVLKEEEKLPMILHQKQSVCIAKELYNIKDRDHSAPYLKQLNKALDISLDQGCKTYIEWALTDIFVLHPWLKDAMCDLGM